ncbi:hypothetical protein AALB81_03230 [Lachnospiraceae bacterium 48-33]
MEPEVVVLAASASPATSMTAFLGLLGSVVTAIFNNVVEIGTIIVETPLLAFPVGIFFAGACVGILGRFLNRG